MTVPTKREKRSLGLLVGIFVAVAFVYSVLVPAWEAPDEIAHYRFSTFLLEQGSLPDQRVDRFGEAHQPPLYYALAATLISLADRTDPSGMWVANPDFMRLPGQLGNQINAIHSSRETFPYAGHALALHLGRWFSLLCMAGVVWLSVCLGWMIFPNRRWLGFVAGGIVATTPQFLFISGVMNNDTLLALLTAGGWVVLGQVINAPTQVRRWWLLGVLASLALLTKLSGFTVGLVAGLALLWLSYRRRSWTILIRGGLGLLVPSLLITGWWFLRNHMRYGDPLGLAVYREVFAANGRSTPLSWADLGQFAQTQFQSFWGQFGWMGVLMPNWVYIGFFILTLAGGAGLVYRLYRARIQIDSARDTLLIFLLIAILIQEIFVLWTITGCNQSCYQGRYLFPVIGPLMLFLTLGLERWLPTGWPRPIFGGMLTAMFVLAVVVPFWLIIPAYPTVPLAKWRLWAIDQRLDRLYGTSIALQGYDLVLEPARDSNGQTNRVVLTIYWQLISQADFDYTAFVHLLDADGHTIAQSDQSPGMDRGFPLTKWWPDDIVSDRHTLIVPQGVQDEQISLRVGLYDYRTGINLPVVSRESPADDGLDLIPVVK